MMKSLICLLLIACKCKLLRALNKFIFLLVLLIFLFLFSHFNLSFSLSFLMLCQLISLVKFSSQLHFYLSWLFTIFILPLYYSLLRLYCFLWKSPKQSYQLNLSWIIKIQLILEIEGSFMI